MQKRPRESEADAGRQPPVEHLLSIALEAATAGAAVLSKYAHEPLRITVKGEAGDLVTQVDLAAEKAVRAIIGRARPDDSITGEELDAITGVDATVRWSIDPLDGTTNYIRGLPHYCTSVAALDVRTGEWLAGVVIAPVLGQTYFASLGGGAWLRTATGTRRLTGPSENEPSPLFGTGFSYSEAARQEQLRALPGLMATYHDLRSIGSAALGLCEVAAGTLDVFVESDLFEFDWAAGALIAEEAGVGVNRPLGMRGGISTVPCFGSDGENRRWSPAP